MTRKLIFHDSEGIAKKIDYTKGIAKKKYNGWFGVGLGSSYYSKENLKFYSQWAAKHLDKFLFIIADDIECYNLIVFLGLSKKKALQEAKKRGEKKYNLVIKIARQFQDIEVRRWQDLASDKKYQRIFEILDQAYDEIPQFRDHIDSSLWANIRKKLELLKSKIGEKEFHKRFRVLVKYAIEEISSIIYLGLYDDFPIKVGHKGERVYDNIADRIYSKYYPHIYRKIKPTNLRGNIYLQVTEK